MHNLKQKKLQTCSQRRVILVQVHPKLPCTENPVEERETLEPSRKLAGTRGETLEPSDVNYRGLRHGPERSGPPCSVQRTEGPEGTRNALQLWCS